MSSGSPAEAREDERCLVSIEGCVVDLGREVVFEGDSETRLTTKESRLLAYLVERSPAPVSRDELLREVWGFRGRLPATRAPDFTVKRLRGKLERDPARPRHILTVHGHGYRFEPLRRDPRER